MSEKHAKYKTLLKSLVVTSAKKFCVGRIFIFSACIFATFDRKAGASLVILVKVLIFILISFIGKALHCIEIDL